MAVGPGSKPALHPLAKGDRGSIIIIVAYAWIFITALITSVRFGLAWNQRLRFKIDDFTFAVGAALAIASSVCFHIASNNGLGKKMAEVPKNDLSQYYKAMYAGELLAIAAMASAKVSVVMLSDRVAPRESRPYNIVLGLVGFWGVFSIFAIALQCGLPEPWVYTLDDCPTNGYMYYPVIILNIITDGILATWILPTLRKLLMDTGKRVTVMVLFGSRLIVCGFAIVQLSSVARHIRNPDVTYEAFGRVLWGLCVMHLSVLLATLPRTNRFIAALHSSHLTTVLTDFELANPNGMRAPPKDVTFGTTEDMSKGSTTAPDDVHTRSRSASHAHSSSRGQSPSRSHHSSQPIVEVPLQLTPSVEQGFSTQIMSQGQSSSQDQKKQKQNSKRYESNDWKKYLKRSKNDDDMNVSSMFSWKSRSSLGHERIVQTREVTQEVEVVQPKESRWVRRQPQRVNRG